LLSLSCDWNPDVRTSRTTPMMRAVIELGPVGSSAPTISETVSPSGSSPRAKWSMTKLSLTTTTGSASALSLELNPRPRSTSVPMVSK